MREANERVHQGELARVIKRKALNALLGRCDGRLRELSKPNAIDKDLWNVLLDAEIVIIDRR